jgi:hypothetical protein
MGLNFPGDWLFDPPVDGRFANAAMPDAAVSDCFVASSSVFPMSGCEQRTTSTRVRCILPRSKKVQEEMEVIGTGPKVMGSRAVICGARMCRS